MPYPEHSNNQHWEKACSAALNALALEFHVAMPLIHHTNKIGEVSGSNGIAGGATAVFKVIREKGSTEGRIVCDGKHRHGDDSMCFRGDFTGGRWSMDEVTLGQIETEAGTGRRQLCDWLSASGPAVLSEVCAGNPDMKPKTVSDLLTRLRRKGLVVRSAEGQWDVPRSAAQAARPRCAADCGVPLDRALAAAGIDRHPDPKCDPVPTRPTLVWGHDDDGRAFGGYDDDGRPLPAEDGGGLATVTELRPAPADEGATTGGHYAPVVAPRSSPSTEPIGDEDQADEPERTPGGFRDLVASLAKIKPRPVLAVMPEGHPNAGPRKQHRSMPQWEAAAEAASSTVTGYPKDWQAAALADCDPGALLVVVDKVSAFMSAAGSVAATAELLEPFGAFDCHPKEMGKPHPNRQSGRTGLAGIVLVECPGWDHPELPHPLGRRAEPGKPLLIPSNMLEYLWKLHQAGELARPVVLDSWLGPRRENLLDPFAALVRKERAAAGHDSELDKRIKRASSIAISCMRSLDKGRQIYRPDWYAAVAGESMTRLHARAREAVQAGAVLAGMSNTDEVAWLVPAGADPAAYLPPRYEVGDAWGQYRRKPVQIKPGADLSGIDPARIAPAEHYPGHVLISGALPLHIWRHRA
jgi:hypothetical protein